MTGSPLDLDTVRAFLRVAELGSFTRAADALQTTQGAVSLKLKRLEERLGVRLVERTPRHVELSRHGATFLDAARRLVAAHDEALAAVTGARQRLVVGISDHVAGPELPGLIARMNAQEPRLLVEIRIGSSAELLQGFDRREFDTVLVRFHAGRDDGQVIAQERLGWFASSGWRQRADEPLPLATMPGPCGVRDLACRALDEAGIAWTEVFSGGGVAAVAAAVVAGLGVAALAPRMLPADAVDVGPALGLPELPLLPVLLHTRIRSGPAREALDALAAAFRNAVR